MEDVPQKKPLDSLHRESYMDSLQSQQQYPDSQTDIPPKMAMEERHLVGEPGADGAAPAGQIEEDQDMQEMGYQQEVYPDEAGAMAGKKSREYVNNYNNITRDKDVFFLFNNKMLSN